MTTTLPTRQQIDTATPLDFPEREKQANISLTAGPNGLTVTIEWTGPVSGIAAAIERLRTAGILELVSAGATKPAAQNGAPPSARKAAQRATPQYLDNGVACCPVHGKELQEGRFGLYCPSRATGDQAANSKGYCSISFRD